MVFQGKYITIESGKIWINCLGSDCRDCSLSYLNDAGFCTINVYYNISYGPTVIPWKFKDTRVIHSDEFTSKALWCAFAKPYDTNTDKLNKFNEIDEIFGKKLNHAFSSTNYDTTYATCSCYVCDTPRLDKIMHIIDGNITLFGRPLGENDLDITACKNYAIGFMNNFMLPVSSLKSARN